jgi:ribosomal protein S18 acetylase RimI-like enzyme
MMDIYTFSLAEEADREAVLKLYTACSKIPGCTWSEEYPTRETFDNDLNNGWLYCLKEGNKVIAAVSLGDFGEFNDVDLPWSKAIRHPCELARIGVLPLYGGKGIGTLVLNHAINTARKLNFDGIRLMVSPQNPPAVAMYRRAGFKIVGEVDRFDMHWICQDLAL